MNVEYTGRHYEVTPAIRKDVEIRPHQNPQNSRQQV